jgi:hypothetical protein
MPLHLVFGSVEHPDVFPDGLIRLTADRDWVRLPDLVLVADRAVWLHELLVTPVDRGPAVPEELHQAWHSGPTMASPVLVVPGARVSAYLPQPVVLQIIARYREQDPTGNWLGHCAPDAVRTVRISWFEGPSGTARTGHAPAAPAASTASTASTAEPPAWPAEGGPAASAAPGAPAEAGRRVAEYHHGLAAVDFGTTGSTVTLWDQNAYPTPVLPDSQAELLREQLVQLLQAAAPSGHREAWAALTGQVVAKALGPGRTAADLVTTLAGAGAGTGAGADSPVLQDTLHGFDTAIQGGVSPLSSWLFGRLQQLYARTFAAPAPEHWKLWRLPLAETGDRTIIASTVTLRRDGTDLRVGRPLDDVDDVDDDRITVPSLKRHFGSRSSRDLEDCGLNTDEVVAGAISWLIRAVDRYTADPDSPGLDPRPLDQVVVTYPTALPGEARRRLRRLVGELSGVRDVDISYDEAVAAGFYFLMRDLGSDPWLGLEALRARMRPMKGNPALASENLLVVDIGGGTTDIALFTITLRDASPSVPGVPPDQAGRLYQISPSLRGTNGVANRGGDFLTLGIFHWLKATLADALLAGRLSGTGPDPWLSRRLMEIDKSGPWWDGDHYRAGKLVELELAHLMSDKAMAGSGPRVRLPHREVVEKAIPTRWRADPARRPAFHLLWRMAERAKIDSLGRGEAFVPRPDEVAGLLAAVRGGEDPAHGDLAGTLSLGPDTFRDLAVPLLRRLARLAVGLVEGRLGEAGQPLDRLILTGRASGFDLVGEVFAETFAKAAAVGRVRWDPTSLHLDPAGAKGATSIGAAWAARMQRLGRDPGNAEDVVRGGGLEVQVDVDNIFQTLPATFVIDRGGDDPAVFEADQEFDVEANEVRRLERPLGRLPETLVVMRVIDGDGSRTRWGEYHIWSDAQDEGYHPPGVGAAGGGGNPGAWLQQLDSRLEINPLLELTLHIWNTGAGPDRIGPAYLVEEPGTDLTRIEPNVDVLDLAARLAVVIGNGDDSTDRLVFGSSGSPAWTHWLATGDRLDGGLRRGIVSTVALPRPGRSGWQFHLRSSLAGGQVDGQVDGQADGFAGGFAGGQAGGQAGGLAGGQSDGTGDARPQVRRVDQPPVQVPSGADGWYASLDDTGVLRVHPGRPAYQEAKTLAEMDAHPGAVYSCSMDTRREDDDSSDPFNGTQ